MDVDVYYRGAANKLHSVTVQYVNSARDVADAIEIVEKHVNGDKFVQKPFLVLIKGGKQ